MPTSFGIPNMPITRGTAPANNRRMSSHPDNRAYKNDKQLRNPHTSPNFGYQWSLGGWASQGGFNGMRFNEEPKGQQLYVSPLEGPGEPTLIPGGSLHENKKGVIKLEMEDYEKNNLSPLVSHPITTQTYYDAKNLYK